MALFKAINLNLALARKPVLAVMLAALSFAATPLLAQDSLQGSGKPDASTPDATQQPSVQPDPAPPDPAPPPAINQPTAQQGDAGKKGSRVFGVMPNQLTVEGATVVTPISAGEKFKLAAEGTFDPYEWGIVGILAGIGQANNDPPEFGQGAKGFGLRYGTDFGDQVIGNIMVGAVVPSIFHQDPRYFQSGKGSFWHRTGYAMSRVLITRSDSGKKEFNISEIGGTAAAGVIANTYAPPAERSIEGTAQTWSTQILVDAIGFELKEFWPDIRRRFMKKKTDSQ